MKNENGSILVSGLGFLLFFLAAIFAISHLLGLIQEQRSNLRSCREVTSRHLNIIKRDLKKITALNPLAQTLRTKWTTVNEEIVEAEAALPESLPVLEALLAERQTILEARQELDSTQRFLLGAIEAENVTYVLEMTSRVFPPHLTSQFSYIKSPLTFSTIPKEILIPDMPDIAPVYEPNAHFSNLSVMAATWQEYQLKDEQWIKNENSLLRWENQCGFELQPPSQDFAVRVHQMNPDKPSLRPSF